MSSLRNSIQRRNHKERAQPLEREKWGILEKRKDYSLRAQDFAKKKTHIRRLREKATDRNPDEFSFGMMNARSKGGVKQADRGNKAMSHEVVKLLKTQDQGYIKNMLTKVRRERQRAEEGMVLDDEGVRALKDGIDGDGEERRSKHMVFVEGEEDQGSFDPEEWFGVNEDALERTWNRRKSQVEAQALPRKQNSQKAKETEEQRQREQELWQKKKERYQQSAAKKLEVLKAKEHDLAMADQELELQRARTNHQIGGVNKNGAKFKIRKRRR